MSFEFFLFIVRLVGVISFVVVWIYVCLGGGDCMYVFVFCCWFVFVLGGDVGSGCIFVLVFVIFLFVRFCVVCVVWVELVWSFFIGFEMCR